MTAPKLKPLAEQVIAITGASSGIGLVTARAAAKAGARVMLIARDELTLARTVREIEGAGGEAACFAADVGDLAAVRAAADAAVARWGRIDTWVNNAGVAIYAKLLDTPGDEHEQLFRTNYFGVVHGSLVAAGHLRAHGGALITVASVAADIPSPLMGAYAASKHAVQGYTRSLRAELAADGLPIAVTLIKPAGIDTPVAEHAATHVEGAAMIPPPVYDPAVVARAILDAAVNVRREVTVGGIGRLQVLTVEHFPWMLDLLARWMEPLLHDPSRPQPGPVDLHRTAGEGRERSETQPGRSFSLYTAARRRPGLVAAAVVGAGALALLGGSSRRRD